jgi:hypothetical protein
MAFQWNVVLDDAGDPTNHKTRHRELRIQGGGRTGWIWMDRSTGNVYGRVYMGRVHDIKGGPGTESFSWENTAAEICKMMCIPNTKLPDFDVVLTAAREAVQAEKSESIRLQRLALSHAMSTHVGLA